jgi:site-specific recombinase XerD
MHSLRSALAKTLLEGDVMVPVISEILGHRDTRTTGIYLNVATENLRMCTLDTKEVFDAQ